MVKKKKTKKEAKQLELTYDDVINQMNPLASALVKISMNLPITIKDNKALIPLRNEMQKHRDDYDHQRKLIKEAIDTEFPVPAEKPEPEKETKKEKEKRVKYEKKRIKKQLLNEEAYEKRMLKLFDEKIEFNVKRITISEKNLDKAIERDIKRLEQIRKLDPDTRARATEFTTDELIALDPIVEIKD